MSIINSSSTGHSAKQERKFANKLFLGLGLLIGISFVIFLFMSQSQDLKTAPVVPQLETSK